jgi:hypothetical protein
MGKDELLEQIRVKHRQLERCLFYFERGSNGAFVASSKAGSPLWVMAAANTSNHYRWAKTQLRKWLRARNAWINPGCFIGGRYYMDEQGFREFLKRGGRSKSAVARCVVYVKEFEQYLQVHRGGKGLDEAGLDELEDFVAWIEQKPKTSAKTHLWAIRYYYDYTSNEDMRNLAGVLREERITRTPFALKEFRGVNPEYVEKLAAVGIRNVKQMLEAGRTRSGRQELSARSGIPLDAVLEFVKLSDLARIPGVKSIRARLYYDAGVDTIEKMAQWDPQELRTMIVQFVEQTGFDGIATLPAEARFTVQQAKKLPRIVEY